MEEELALLVKLRAELIELREICGSRFVRRSIDAEMAELDARLNGDGGMFPVIMQAGIDPAQLSGLGAPE